MENFLLGIRNILPLVGILLISCTDPKPSSQAEEIPDWLDTRIAQLDPDPSIPMTITRWQYKGETVYYIPPSVHDGLGCVYDNEGNGLGCPDGGITGKGDGTLQDFFDSRESEEKLWSFGH